VPYPKQYFESNTDEEQHGQCFVIMPFAATFSEVYTAIRRAMEAPDLNFRCGRADELFGGHEIMTDILGEIARAEVVIADLTGRNPNVFYELGITHMTKDARRVLLIAQNIDDVPFDLRPYRCIVYAPDATGLRELTQRLSTSAREVASDVYRFSVTRGGEHDTEPLFSAPDRCLYSFHISEPMLGRGFVKCRVRVMRHAIGESPKEILNAGLGLSENEVRVPCRSVPWALRLDDAQQQHAAFSVVPIQPERRAAKRR
jgi:hypothetical protein